MSRKPSKPTTFSKVTQEEVGILTAHLLRNVDSFQDREASRCLSLIVEQLQETSPRLVRLLTEEKLIEIAGWCGIKIKGKSAQNASAATRQRGVRMLAEVLHSVLVKLDAETFKDEIAELQILKRN